jgi:hypothetical protein
MDPNYSRMLFCVVTVVLSTALSSRANSAPVIVDVIPKDLSNESGSNSEPSIAVNPSNTNQLAISSFFDFYFDSQNGGQSWRNFQHLSFGDSTLAWSPGGTLYNGRLVGEPNKTIDVPSSPPPNNPPTLTAAACGASACNAYDPMGASRPDQPWIQVTRVGDTDRIYVGFSDTDQATGRRMAKVRYSTDGGATWANETIDRRVPLPDDVVQGRIDGVPVRVAASGDRVYAAFQRWTGSLDGDKTSDIVVVRDGRQRPSWY